jgi:hypothetical protein
MACPYPSSLKQSLGQTFFTKFFLIQKTFLFPLTSQKIHLIPVYILSSCLLCNLNFKFIIGAEATN